MTTILNETQLSQGELGYTRVVSAQLRTETRRDISSGSRYVATRFGDTWVVSFNFDGRMYTQEVTQ